MMAMMMMVMMVMIVIMIIRIRIKSNVTYAYAPFVTYTVEFCPIVKALAAAAAAAARPARGCCLNVFDAASRCEPVTVMLGVDADMLGILGLQYWGFGVELRACVDARLHYTGRDSER